jgi:predicted esterase
MAQHNLTMIRQILTYRSIFAALSGIIFFTAAVSAQLPTAGTVQTVQCINDSNSSYSLYLPRDYVFGNKYELIIFLDPSARGDVPVQKYRSMADETGVVLAGSFDSKNFDLSSAEKAIPAIITDIQKRNSIGPSQIWLAGFSGGSRMASSYAATYNGINGVIACGAGFAQGDQGTGNDFINPARIIPYVGIVGNRDMNFEEMVGVKEQLSASKHKNLLLLFEGEHEWPPAGSLGVAIRWLQQFSSAAASKGGENLAAQLINEYTRFNATGTVYYSWLQAQAYLKLPVVAATADSLIRVMEAQRNFGREKENFETVLDKERNFMDQFSILFQQAIYAADIRVDNAALWKPKIAFISELKNDKNACKKLSGQRVYDFGWRLCSEQYSWLMQSNLFKQAYCSAYILSFFEGLPNNPEYMMARAAAGFSDKALCLAHLKKAVKKGGLAKERVMKDSLINSLVDANTIQKLFDN